MWPGGTFTLIVAAVLLSPLTAAVGVMPCSECSYATDLSEHDTISIVGDGGLTAENGVVSGSGTQEDPYILEGWDINASDEIGIRIAYTSAYVIVRDVYIHDGSTTIPSGAYMLDDNEGIVLDTVENLVIEDVRVDHCLYGIYLNHGADMRVEGSEIHGCMIGVMADETWDATVAGNTVDGCGRFGIGVQGTVGTIVEGNDVRDCPAGVSLRDDTVGTTVQGNTLALNEVGISCDGSGYGVIEGNDIALNDAAVVVTESASMTIRGNLMEENGCGVYLVDGYGCEVYGNDFASNGMQAFEFAGGLNTWFDEENQTGNHWSDHDGNGPRTITTDVEDPYPVEDGIWQGELFDYDDEPDEEDWAETYQGPFYSNVIDSGYLSWSNPGIEMVPGNDGDLHAVYAVDGIIRHSHREDGRWGLSTLDLCDRITSSIAAMVDDDGNLNAAYVKDFDLDGEEPQIMRAVEEDGTYRLFSLGDSEPHYTSSCVAMDSEGNVYIAYVTREQVAVVDYLVVFAYGISCMHNANGNWTTETVFDGSELVPSELKMDLGEDGSIHLAYCSRSENATSLMYATRENGEWSIEGIVDFEGEWVTSGLCLDLDSSGTPHIAFWNGSYPIYWYYEQYSNTLRHAVKNPSGWDIHTVATDFRVGEVMDMALGTDDRPRILYQDSYNSDAMYAEPFGDNMTEWQTFRLDTVGWSWDCGALVVDEEGEVHAVYLTLHEYLGFGGGSVDIVYVTTQEPAGISGDGVDVRYAVLACVVVAVLVGAYALRRRMT